MKKVRNSQAFIPINSCTKLSKTTLTNDIMSKTDST